MRREHGLRAKLTLIGLLVSLLLLAGIVTGCSVLTQRQQLVFSTKLFSAAVDSVDKMHKDGKLTDKETKDLIPYLKSAEMGLDEWKAALNKYEKEVSAAKRHAIRSALQAVADAILKANTKGK